MRSSPFPEGHKIERGYHCKQHETSRPQSILCRIASGSLIPPRAGRVVHATIHEVRPISSSPGRYCSKQGRVVVSLGLELNAAAGIEWWETWLGQWTAWDSLIGDGRTGVPCTMQIRLNRLELGLF